MRHKVVLYNPKAVFFDMPLALVAIGSALDAQRFEVIIVDGRMMENPLEALRKACQGALCLGVTTLTGAPLKDAIFISRRIKAEFPQLPIIWGGWHTSLFPTQTLEDVPEVDITVQAQGEVSFREICEHLAEGASLAGISGISIRKEGIASRNPARPLADMNELPAYNYELIDVESYFKAKGRRQFDYFTSTGCYFRCAFCADPFVFQRKWSALEPERIASELAHWQSKYEFEDVNFQDETFFTYRKRIMAIGQAFLDRKLDFSWAGTMRADQSHRLSEDDFILLKRSGLRRVLIGVESGSQEMMDWMKKDIKIEHVWEAAERCKQHGIAVIFPFIVGFPDESDKSFAQSLEMAAQLRAMSPQFQTPIFYFKPYPGSEITRKVEAGGYALPQSIDEWAAFDYIGSSGPWVSPEKYKRVERFKFYNQLAWMSGKAPLIPLKLLARWRLKHMRFGLPLEKKLADLVRPSAKLS